MADLIHAIAPYQLLDVFTAFQVATATIALIHADIFYVILDCVCAVDNWYSFKP